MDQANLIEVTFHGMVGGTFLDPSEIASMRRLHYPPRISLSMQSGAAFYVVDEPGLYPALLRAMADAHEAQESEAVKAGEAIK